MLHVLDVLDSVESVIQSSIGPSPLHVLHVSGSSLFLVAFLVGSWNQMWARLRR